MEIIPFRASLRRHWRRRGYNRVSVKSAKVARLGTKYGKRTWKLRLAPKLRLASVSPMKLWHKFKNAYMNMMLRVANSTDTNNGGGNLFGTKRIPQGRDVSKGYSRSEFENRLIFEIYKSMVDSYELGYTPNKSLATSQR